MRNRRTQAEQKEQGNQTGPFVDSTLETGHEIRCASLRLPFESATEATQAEYNGESTYQRTVSFLLSDGLGTGRF